MNHHPDHATYDVAIVGGGINGVGIAAEAASRGLKTILFEQADLAEATSSASTKLIHGGLRYLAQGHLKMVYTALQEREILLRRANHLVHPLQIVIPINQYSKPVYQLFLGLKLYDQFAHSSVLRSSQYLRLMECAEGFGLTNQFRNGFSYYDAFTDDSRLVIANAQFAKKHGAEIYNYHQVSEINAELSNWVIKARSHHSLRTIHAKLLVNACGPWVHQLPGPLKPKQEQLQWVAGSHIVVQKLYPGDHAYLLQNHDGRVIFVIPYLNQFHMIGTTDQVVESPEPKAPQSIEIQYLLQVINQHFRHQVSEQHVIYSWNGIRTLIADPQKKAHELSREATMVWQQENNMPPVIHIIGGKLSTYRHLAEECIDQSVSLFPHIKPSITRHELLPGALGEGPRLAWLAECQHRALKIPSPLINRWFNQYGAQINLLLDQSKSLDDLGQHIAGDLYERELNYLINEEWVQAAEDILWRRSKAGILWKAEEQSKLRHWFQQNQC